MIRWKTEYEGAFVQGSSYDVEAGVCECHMMVHACPCGTFEQQLEALHSAFEQASETGCAGMRPVFVRYFLSDAANQADVLGEALQGRYGCAVSVIEQPPLDGTKVAMWALMQSEGSSAYRHIWTADSRVEGGDSEAQTRALLEDYDAALAENGCSVAENCLRTWFFVQDVDENYAGVVKGRKEMFDRVGLTKETHYLASTGIAGRNAAKTSLVTMDAYAVKGLEEEYGRDMIRFLYDGQVQAVQSETLENMDNEYFWPFNKPHFILLNMAIGGSMGGQVSEQIFNQSIQMKVDWVRVYQRKEI